MEAQSVVEGLKGWDQAINGNDLLSEVPGELAGAVEQKHELRDIILRVPVDFRVDCNEATGVLAKNDKLWAMPTYLCVC